MRTKALVAILFAAALLLGVNSKASAASAWYRAAVVEAGPSSGYILFCLQNSPSSGLPNTFSGLKWCRATTTDANKMLATALTAKSLGKKVRVYTDLTVSTPEIQSIIMMDQ